MPKIKTSELTGLALDWAVAKCLEEQANTIPAYWTGPVIRGNFSPSTNWAAGGPIIDREGISWHCGNKSSWHAYAYGSAENFTGPTPLVAAMRCFVASKLGNEVDVPEELT